MADDIVLNKLKDHADLARHVDDAGWKLRIGNRGPEVYPNLFQDAADLIEAQQAEIERLRRWKAEATEVLLRWDTVADMVPARIGDRKSDAVADEIERLRAENAKQRAEIIRLESLSWSARRGVRRG